MPTAAEARTHFLAHMPPGATQWMNRDLGTVANVWTAIAQSLKAYGFDVLDQLRRELKARQMVDRIPDWERILHVSDGLIARTGSLDARRAQIIARRRENGASSKPNILAALQAVCGPTAATILEHNRTTVSAVNTHDFGPITATVGTVGSASVVIGDNAQASKAGARLVYNVGTGTQGAFQFLLTSPDRSKSWQSEVITDGGEHWLFWPDFAGGQIAGTWTLQVDNSLGGAADVQVDTARVIVEGIGRAGSGAEGLGAIIFEWSALIDETAVASTYNRALVVELVRRWTQSHRRGYVALKQTNGDTGAVCGDANCIAGMTVCGN